MRRILDDGLSLLIPTCILLHLAFAPYTKVEESFNLQATHDILTYGLPFEDANQKLQRWYDHLEFPGSVPRTFVGPLILAGVGQPFLWLLKAVDIVVNRQSLVRAVLGLFNAYCLISFRNRVAKAFGRNAANWYALLQAGQFHIMFYASRTLPNFFAFGLVTLANRNLLPLAGRSPSSRSSRKRQTTAIILMTATTIVFRSEIAILLACSVFYFWLHPFIRLPITSIIISGLIGAFVGLALTVTIDTHFWQSPTPLWPELAAFKYNVLDSKAIEWGASPWHFYFTSSLPRLLFNPFVLFLIPFALSINILRGPALDILIPHLLFISIYSFQPHKEWRFIVYSVPPLLAIASAGASWIWIRRAKTMTYRLLSMTLIASIMATFAASAAMCAISRLNYPGAEALQHLHQMAGNAGASDVVRVHLDTLSCTTGVTRFLQKEAVAAISHDSKTATNKGISWVYHKTEDKEKLHDPAYWQTIDYALAENPAACLGDWETLETIYGFGGVKFVRSAENQGQQRMNTATIGQQVHSILHEGLQQIKGNKHGRQHLFHLISSLYDQCTMLLREKLTKGWWIGLKMEPRIRIMKRLTPIPVVEDDEPGAQDSEAQSLDANEGED